MIAKVVFGLEAEEFVSAVLYNAGENAVNLLEDPEMKKFLVGGNQQRIEQSLIEALSQIHKRYRLSSVSEMLYDGNEDEEGADTFYRYHLVMN